MCQILESFQGQRRERREEAVDDYIHFEVQRSRKYGGSENVEFNSIIRAAIGSQVPQFADQILAGLKDRSIYIKIMVVEAISREPYLRTPEAKRELERLLKMKSIATVDHDRRRVEHALATFTT